MKNAHDWTWSMARKLKIMDNEKYTLQELENGEPIKLQNEKCTLQDTENGEKTENHSK